MFQMMMYPKRHTHKFEAFLVGANKRRELFIICIEKRLKNDILPFRSVLC